jgi:hypothetical protein
MDDTSADRIPPANGVPPAALAALGLLSLAGSATRHGVRVAAVVWRSPPAAPARLMARPVTGALARRGRLMEDRWIALRPTGITERVVGVAVEHAIVERASAELLRAGVLEHVADQVAESELPQSLVDDLLAQGLAERLAPVVLDSPELEQAVTRALDSPGLERLVLRIADSQLVDALTDRVLASPELHRIVGKIAESEEVRAALSEQSRGMAEDVGDQLRARSVSADDAAERAVRRLLKRRRHRPTTPGPQLG